MKAVLGTVNLVRFSDDGEQAALGYWLVLAARGQGNALVLITHESTVAAAAQRTISLEDGRILTDTQT
jgi:predicted ABC-type transport system involved in lysophospholipase L1 biosynthesis ATPase subunit